jgi:hypothetical protein
VTYGLTPRPNLAPEEMAALVVVAEQLLRRDEVADAVDVVPAWRFSGRWFNSGPYTNRRPHRLS